MKKTKKLMLIVLSLAAITSCSSSGKVDTDSLLPSYVGENLKDPTFYEDFIPTRSTSKRFVSTDLTPFQDKFKSVGFDYVGETVSTDNGASTGKSNYSVNKNQIGFSLNNRRCRKNFCLLNIAGQTTMNVNPGGAAIELHDGESVGIGVNHSIFNRDPIGFIKVYLNDFIRNGNNLSLNMQPGSILFLISEYSQKLTSIDKVSNLSDILDIPASSRPSISGTNFWILGFNNSSIFVDRDVNLDNPDDTYNQLITYNSTYLVLKNVKIEGTKDNQIGIKNEFPLNISIGTDYGINSGTISLKGNNSIGAYGVYSSFTNNGKIIVENNSTGIYWISDSKLSEVLGSGILPPRIENGSAVEGGLIKIGESSIGIHFDSRDGNGIVRNEAPGAIRSISNNAIGITVKGNFNSSPYLKSYNTFFGSNYKVINHGEITLLGDKSIGIYASGTGSYNIINIDSSDGKPQNDGRIIIGKSFDRNNPSIGMYSDNPKASLVNNGLIQIGENSVGMAGVGTMVNETKGTIKITENGGVGMHLGENSVGVNNGTITTVGSPNNAIGVVVGNGSEFTNNGKIIINSASGAGIVISGGVVKNYGDIQVSGGAVPSRNDTAGIEKITVKSGNSSIKRGDLGVYVDTLGKTNPIDGLSNLGLDSADLLIGAEATEKTNATEVAVSEDVIKPFNDSIQSSNIDNWNVKSGSLVWEAESKIKDNNVEKVTLKKQSYAKYADEKTEEVAKALDEKYTLTSAESKDKEVFNSINKLKSGNELAKTYKEVSGGQYINVQQRINQTDEVLERELTGLKNDKFGKDGHHISTFAGKDNYEAKTPEIAKSSSVNYGAAYLYNDASNEWGAYAGAVMNKFKLEDEGKSKENVTFVKVGAYKIFNLGIVDWTLSGEGNISWNEMKRRYVSAGTVYENKADYNSYGFAVKNEVSKIYQLNDIFTFKPYGALKIGFGKFTDIKEKNSTLGLSVKGNDYYSFKPMAGIELGLSVPVGTAAKFKAGLGLGYEHELGKIENTENEAKFSNAGTSWKLKGVKGEDKGGLKSDLKAGFEAGNYNIFLTGGYNTKGKNSHVGINFGVSF